MGILDDAIREHLELKRKHGATEEELSRQEAEALGPARRQPAAADPDAFGAESGNGEELLPPPDLSTAASADLDAPPPPPPPQEFAPIDTAEPPPPPLDEPEPEPTAAADFSPVDELDPLEPDPADRLPPHGDVEPLEPLDHEQPVGLDEPAAPIHAEPAADDPVAPPPRPEPESELDFPATEILPADESAAEAEPADPGPEPPEPDFDETLPPRDEATHARPLPPLDDDTLPPEPAVPDEPAGDSEDVLEETPDFLQDTPEHDRLWFEQKPPRDFDFDD